MIDKIESAFTSLQEKIYDWLQQVILNLPNFLIAVLIVIVGWYVAKAVHRFVSRLLFKASGSFNVASLLASIARVIVVGFAIFIGLSVLGLSGVVASGLAGAGIAGLAIGFALQDPLANLFSGIMMSVKELYKPGDLIESNGFFGTIEGISLRTTMVKTLQGQEVAIPNKDVLQNPLTNYSTHGSRRIDLEFGISYGDDLRKAQGIVINAIKRNVDYLVEKPVEVYWTDFGDSSINGILRFWQPISSQKDFLLARSQAIVSIKEAFDREDIMIPFPIRTLDFGIRGGEQLSEMKINIAEKLALSENEKG